MGMVDIILEQTIMETADITQVQMEMEIGLDQTIMEDTMAEDECFKGTKPK